MTIPLVILALFAAGIGWWMESSHWFVDFLAMTPSLAFAEMRHTTQVAFHPEIALISTLVALSGIALAMFFYLGESRQIDFLARCMGPLYRASYAKFFVDEIYQIVIVWPLQGLAWFCYLFDQYVVDGLVNFLGRIPPALGRFFRRSQTGMLQTYAVAMVALGLLILVGTLLLPLDTGNSQPNESTVSPTQNSEP